MNNFQQNILTTLRSFRLVFWGGLLFASVVVSYGNPVFYAVHSGENYEKVTWHEAPTKEIFEKLRDTISVFDSYSKEAEDGKGLKIHRSYSTPSGDWGFKLVYHYEVSGVLSKIVSDFQTHTGYDAELDEFFPTRCEREFKVNEKGALLKVAEKITDLKTGEIRKRSFYDPKVKHWAHVLKIPSVGSESKSKKK